MENSKTLRFQGVVMVVLLVIQYVLGMKANLFSDFPTSASDSQLWKYAWSQFPLAAHIILGLLLLIGAIVLVVRSVMVKDKKWITFSLIGLLTIFIAGFSG